MYACMQAEKQTVKDAIRGKVKEAPQRWRRVARNFFTFPRPPREEAEVGGHMPVPRLGLMGAKGRAAFVNTCRDSPLFLP